MYFNGNKIKLSFSRAKYQTVGNTVYCTLQYTVNVPGAYSDMIATVANDKQTFTTTAKATCNGDDIFDKKLGRDIANARAEAKAYRHAKNLVSMARAGKLDPVIGEQAGEGYGQEVL